MRFLIGRAEIEGLPCQLSVMDLRFSWAGSMGSGRGRRKFARACEQAVARRLPLVSVTFVGGARMQRGSCP